MEALSIKTPADVLSFVGHTLGFWPKESLVCITLDKKNMVGATLRVDLPKSDDGLFTYAQTVAGYINNDANASTVLFAVYTEKPWGADEEKPHAHTVAAPTGALAQQGISIRDGLLVGDEACIPYDGDHLNGPSIPLGNPVQRNQRRIRVPRKPNRAWGDHATCLNQGDLDDGCSNGSHGGNSTTPCSRGLGPGTHSLGVHAAGEDLPHRRGDG